MSRYVICGATGFMGRNIAERFGNLFPGKVVGIWFKTNPPEIEGVTWRQADLRDPVQVDALIKEGDVLIQAAATTSGAKDIIERPYIHTTDNAVINSLLLRVCYEKNAGQFIFTSCPVVYPPDLGRALKETDFRGELTPSSPHFGVGWTKVYIEKMCEFYAKLGRTKHMVFRHSNCYGPYDKYDLDRSHMYGATVTKVMEAVDGGSITVWGPGTEGRDLIYVDDVVDFIVAALQQKNPFELVNLGCGQAYPVIEVVKTIIEASGKNLTIKHDLSKPHIPSKIWLDTSKALELYGWKSKTSLMEGTKKTLAWYKKYFQGSN
ncbi:GDP-L-fucose synthase [Spirochaetia bacterium]|nr:GDP-L-fucose synthase [Spirochaetia bacterium]